MQISPYSVPTSFKDATKEGGIRKYGIRLVKRGKVANFLACTTAVLEKGKH